MFYMAALVGNSEAARPTALRATPQAHARTMCARTCEHPCGTHLEERGPRLGPRERHVDAAVKAPQQRDVTVLGWEGGGVQCMQQPTSQSWGGRERGCSACLWGLLLLGPCRGCTAHTHLDAVGCRKHVHPAHAAAAACARPRSQVRRRLVELQQQLREQAARGAVVAATAAAPLGGQAVDLVLCMGVVRPTHGAIFPCASAAAAAGPGGQGQAACPPTPPPPPALIIRLGAHGGGLVV